MTTIYAIRDDGLKFKELDLEVIDIMRQRPEVISLDDVLQFHRRNTAMASWWQTPETEFISLTSEKAPVPDIGPWIYSTLVLSPKAYRYLGELLADFGEFLPVKANGETYQIFNCFVTGDADEEKCLWAYEQDDGTKMGIRHLEFMDSAANNLIFKTPANACTSLFCNQQFKDYVESFELTGISFAQDLIEFEGD